MACVAMDTNFPDSTEAVELGRRLGERLAWCHACRLWAWGIDQDREDGIINLDDERIAAVSDWRGDPHLFVESMVGVGLLVKQPDGSYYMAGWSRNKEYFAKKRRMREYRKSRRSESRGNNAASPVTPRETPREVSPDTARVPRSRSPSPSLDQERDHGETPRETPRDMPRGMSLDAVKNRLGLILPDPEIDRPLLAGAPYTEAEYQAAIAETQQRLGRLEPKYAAKVLAGIREKRPAAEKRKRDPADYVPSSHRRRLTADGIVEVSGEDAV